MTLLTYDTAFLTVFFMAMVAAPFMALVCLARTSLSHWLVGVAFVVVCVSGTALFVQCLLLIWSLLR